MTNVSSRLRSVDLWFEAQTSEDYQSCQHNFRFWKKFLKKQGYESYGVLDGYPNEVKEYLLIKRFDET